MTISQFQEWSMQTPTYRASARELLDQAKQEFAAGDTRQASEKGWGAAAQMVKAVADQRGWQHHSHFLLRQAVDSIVQETGDTQIFNLFGVASSLHVNFYENWSPAREIESGLHDVERFVEKLESLI
jgi:hypothetical protein